jgi:hypothetical protein
MSSSKKYENIQVLKETKVKKTLKEYAVKNDFTFTQAIENLIKKAK